MHPGTIVSSAVRSERYGVDHLLKRLEDGRGGHEVEERRPAEPESQSQNVEHTQDWLTHGEVSDAILVAVKQPLDVATVLDEYHSRAGEKIERDRQGSGIEGRWSSQQAGQHQDRNRDQRGERDNSCREQDDDPGQYGERRGSGDEHEHRPRPGCDPLAAAKSEIDRKEMSEKGQRRRADAKNVRSTKGGLRARREAVCQLHDDRDRHRTLQEIEQEHERAELSAQDATGVGRADVAAASLEEIDAAGAANEITERDRANRDNWR